ncbi:sigma 54-interacting transcriptional regulator [Halobacillus shinanisalinarum]|uniref:HTH-type transcriptional regulatory protein TyrR n=1 Tax=Halobacillus shinanisalinarum TaxID=2932258 RepID=A0ABY4GVV0_9BACI|nr:sigma 54-interacting transcriptional regulator [Halobacillus shinanisalinarum]UOQ91850.1 sigma 54-interacting transcriptional regulator [Halobacillus shinanisalinarum]
MFSNYVDNLDVETLIKILDYSSDEIFVLDGDMKIIYVNDACKKHYGLNKEDVIGKLSKELVEEGYWTPSIFPEVFEKKVPISVKQTTVLGAELLTSAIPISNEQNEVELVVTTAREIQSYKMLNAKDNFPIQSERKEDQSANIITNNEKMKNILKMSQKVAVTNSNILILGESGTGKGMIAQHIHKNSRRSNGPFLTINCAAIPADLIESELFGYTPGAFTGANRSGKTGLLEAVDGGTLFLDEVGEMPLSLQAKMLQVIQDKKFIPLGGHKEKKVNVRILAATNRNLADMVKKQTFREDLFYRLNVVDIKMPSLRERREDIIPITYHFLYKFNRIYEVNKLISEDCLELLSHYSWPGNVRQLENLVEKLIIISGDVVGVQDIPEGIYTEGKKVGEPPPSSLNEAVELAKKEMVERSYKQHKSSRKVAKELQISQTQASKLIRQYCRDLQGN